MKSDKKKGTRFYLLAFEVLFVLYLIAIAQMMVMGNYNAGRLAHHVERMGLSGDIMMIDKGILSNGNNVDLAASRLCIRMSDVISNTVFYVSDQDLVSDKSANNIDRRSADASLNLNGRRYTFSRCHIG
jgi:hypothetical protein